MAYIRNHRQVRFLFEDCNRGHIQCVARKRLKCADAAFAKDHVVIALGHNVFGRQKKFIQRCGEPAFQKDRFFWLPGIFEQGEILHVSGTDLNAIAVLFNKVDAVRKDRVLPIIDRYKDLFPFREIVPISALTGINLDLLERLIEGLLPEAPKLYSDEEISDQSERFLFAEIVREKILKHVTEELPFVTAVYIEAVEKKEQSDWKTPGATRPVTYIRASIFVEKDNHRKIVIGRHGSLVKQVGIEARQEIAEYIGHKVFLELQVRVRERWRDSEDVLDLIEGQKG